MAYDNPIIAKRFKEKMARLDKTANSILVSWAINNATNTLREEDKKNWKAAKLQIEERYPFFIDLYRDWMIDNMIEPKEPIDPNSPEGEQAAMDIVDPEDNIPIVSQ